MQINKPKIKNYDNKEYFDYAGASGGFIDYLVFPFCRGRIFNTIEKDENLELDPYFYENHNIQTLLSIYLQVILIERLNL